MRHSKGTTLDGPISSSWDDSSSLSGRPVGFESHIVRRIDDAVRTEHDDASLAPPNPSRCRPSLPLSPELACRRRWAVRCRAARGPSRPSPTALRSFLLASGLRHGGLRQARKPRRGFNTRYASFGPVRIGVAPGPDWGLSDPRRIVRTEGTTPLDSSLFAKVMK